jgi:hypothetical protein
MQKPGFCRKAFNALGSFVQSETNELRVVIENVGGRWFGDRLRSLRHPMARSRWRFGALKNCYRRQVKPMTVDYFPKGPNVAATDAGLIS